MDDQERIESLISDLVVYGVAPDIQTAFSYTIYQSELLLKAAHKRAGMQRLSALIDNATASATAFGGKSEGLKKHIKTITSEHGLD